MISRNIHHVRTYPAATQKGVADFCLCQLATMQCARAVNMTINMTIK